MNSTARWITGITCFLSVSILGAFAGGVLATRAVALSRMGVDQISTLLGGFMVGGLIGTFAGALLALKLQPRGHLLVATLALLAAIATLLLAMTWQPRISV